MGLFKTAKRMIKRNSSINFIDSSGNEISFDSWKNKFVSSQGTPIQEAIYSSIASEFAKIDILVSRVVEGEYVDNETATIRNLRNIFTSRPIEFMTPHDFKYLLAYQLVKYGNALAYIERSFGPNGNQIGIARIRPLNVEDYDFGYGFKLENDKLLIQLRRKIDSKILLINYDNLIHLRLNSNDIFMGDKNSIIDNGNTLIKLFDTNLNTLLNEMLSSGEVRGIIELGGGFGGFGQGSMNGSLGSETAKVSKQEEVINRIKQTKGGLLVLDAGEKWHQLNTPFKTMSTEEVNNVINLLYSFKGINEKVVNGTASDDEMEVFFNKSVVPIIEKFIEEINYKAVSQTARTQGIVIDYYRNPFEYVSVVKAGNSAYKLGHLLTQNEARRMIFKLPPKPDGDELHMNKNFEIKDDKASDDSNDE